MLRGRCACNAVAFEVADEFTEAYYAGKIRVPYGSLIDEPTLKPMGHTFVGSKAPWYAILDDLPQHDEDPWS